MSEKTKQKLKFIIDVIYIAMVAGIIFLVGKYVISLIMPFIIALLLVVIVRPIINFINDRIKLNQKVVSPIIMAILYLIIVSLLMWIITRVVIVAGSALSDLPDYYQSTILPLFNKLMDLIQQGLEKVPSYLEIEFDVIKQSMTSAAQDLVFGISQKGITLATAVTNSIPSVMMNLVFTIMLSFFISIYYDAVIHFFQGQMSDKVKNFLGELKSIFKETVLKYIKAAMILMVITFVELSIGLLVLKVPNAIGVAAGISIFDALPFFGTGAAMIPWILIELLQGNYSLALGIGIVYGIVTLVRNILEPKIVGDQLGLNPIVSLMAVYIGYRLFGVIGMIAFPILMQMLMALHKSGRIHLYKEVE